MKLVLGRADHICPTWKKTVLACLSLLLCAGGQTVCADTPYRPYDKTEWETGLAAPAAFAPAAGVNGTQAGCGAMKEPRGMAMDKEGGLYIADTQNHRILIWDRSLSFQAEIKEVRYPDGASTPLKNPTAVFAGTDGALYLTDEGSEKDINPDTRLQYGRAVKIDREGNVLAEYRRPQNESYTSEGYAPQKIAVDKWGVVYILARNVEQGIMLYTQDGRFTEYFGSPRVPVTAGLMMDLFWKSIMTSEQRKGLANYVPTEYSGFTIDDKGFVYPVLEYDRTQTEQIRKLNYKGSNILPADINFGEDEVFDYMKSTWRTRFVDIAVADTFIYTLDSQWQRIYVYDREGNRLAVFGSVGEQLGTFRDASSIQVYDDKVYVLDCGKAAVTVFERTDYGEQIFTAVDLYNRGEYVRAVEPWRRVLAMDANNELAYSGIGEAKLKAGKYKEAVRFFRLGYNRERESVAFDFYRAQVIRANIGIIMILLFAGVAALVLFTNKRFLAVLARGRQEQPEGKIKPVASVMIKPVSGFNELKFKRYRNVPLVLVMMLLLFLLAVASRQYTGFRFNESNPNEFSLFIQFALSTLLFFLFAAANWAVCSIMDGEGKFGEITTFLAIGMIPFLVFQSLSTALSVVLVLDETVILTALSGLGILWSALLVFQGQRIVHNYSVMKTVGAVLLSLAGIVVVAVILLLLFVLGQQVAYFVQSVYTELLFRK